MQSSAEPQTVPAPEPPPSPAPVSITTIGADGKPQTIAIPRSTAEVDALLAQRAELSRQLNSAGERRSNVAAEIQNTSNAATRTGLEGRLRVLDERILQLETDIAITGRQLASTPADLVTRAQGENYPGGGNPGGFEEGMAGGLFIGLLFGIVVYFFTRRRWKRKAGGARVQPAVGESAQRLERLENGMEAIAIEIERVAEGQRFVTKLLSESASPLGMSHRVAQGAAIEQENPAKR